MYRLAGFNWHQETGGKVGMQRGEVKLECGATRRPNEGHRADPEPESTESGQVNSFTDSVEVFSKYIITLDTRRADGPRLDRKRGCGAERQYRRGFDRY